MMRIRSFFFTLISIAVLAAGAHAEESKRLPGLTAPPCSAIFGEPVSGSEPAKMYHMLIFYKAGGPTCFGPAARDVADNPAKLLIEKNTAQFIIDTVRNAPPGKAFLILIGAQHQDPKTDKTYLVPSILTISKTEAGQLQGFKVIGSRQLERGRFVRDMSDADVMNLVAAQEFVIFGRAERGMASEDTSPKFFRMMVDPYVEYLLNTANLECSEEKQRL